MNSMDLVASATMAHLVRLSRLEGEGQSGLGGLAGRDPAITPESAVLSRPCLHAPNVVYTPRRTRQLPCRMAAVEKSAFDGNSLHS